MSYDIRLKNPVTEETILLDDPHLMCGGNFVAGGTREAWLNVTYNYSQWYYKDGVFPEQNGKKLGIRTIYGMTGAESIPVLKSAIAALRDCCEELSDIEKREYESQGCSSYWLPTKANAIIPLTQLLVFAQLRPDGVWAED